MEGLERLGVPCGLVNRLDQTFADPQVLARGLRVDLPHPTAGTIPVVKTPIVMSATPPDQRRPPPLLGEHTDRVLADLLGKSPAEIARLRSAGAL